jgi:hypothetical protein
MIYFKDEPVAPSQLEGSQLTRVAEFKRSLGEQGGLYWPFQSPEDFANLVRMHLTKVVQEWRNKLPTVSGESPTRLPAPSAASSALEADVGDEEPGLLELNEDIEDKFHEASEVLVRIAKATDSIGNKMEKHTKRVQAATVTGSVTRTGMKQIMSKVAKDMNDYAAKLNQEVPVLLTLLQSGLRSVSEAISMWPEFIHDQASRKQAEESVTAIQKLQEVMSKVEGQIQGFLDSVIGLPRVTTELNKAKRSVSTERQGLIALVRSQQQVLAQTERAATSLINEQSEL